MTRTMFDSVTPSAIPANAEIVCGYCDGIYRWKPSDWALFPNAVHIPIAVFPHTNDGIVLDVEQGDATPAQSPGWIRMRQAEGIEVPTVYCSLSVVDQVKQECLGLTYDLWVAHYTGSPHAVGKGEVAVQYVDHGPHGENVDISVVFDDDWPREADMAKDWIGVCENGKCYVFLASGKRVYIGDTNPDLTTLESIYGTRKPILQSFADEWPDIR